MAANCNFVALVWDWVTKARLGLTIGDLSLQPFIDQFNIASGCKQVIPCEEIPERDCDRDFVYLCNFIIGPIDVFTDTTGKTIIGAPIDKFLGGTHPYNIVWEWDPAVFSYVGGQGTASIVLQKLAGVPNTVTTTVSVRAYDGAGCKDNGDITFGFPDAIPECGAFNMNPVDSYIGIPYTGTILIPYGGGNGADYTGITVQSTGVAGLTATLPSGTLAMGDGNLVFNVSGVPESNGNGQFSFKLFEDTLCVIPFGTAETQCGATQASITYHPFDIDNNTYPVEVNWLPKADAVSYSIYVQHGIGNPGPPVVVPAPGTSLMIQVAPQSFFTVTVVVNCFFDSPGVVITDTAPPVPAPCPIPTNLSAAITTYDPIKGLFRIQLRWDIMTGATAYIVTDVSTGQSFTTGSRIFPIYKAANGSYQFKVKVDCGNLAGESPEASVTINTPATPVNTPASWPQIHYIDNVSTGASNAWMCQLWLTVDSDVDSAVIQQKSPFDTSNVFPYISNAIPTGQSSQTPLPPGFGPNDIFYSNQTPPQGVTLYGSTLNFLRVSLIKSPAPFQDTATNFDYWMNVPEQYTIRMSNEDYITTNPTQAAIRPTFIVTYPGSGAVDITLVPVLTYDSCSKYNMFLVAETGGIFTRTYVGLPGGGAPLKQSFTGLAPGKYLVFAEHTYSACSIPGNVETAIPILITIT